MILNKNFIGLALSQYPIVLCARFGIPRFSQYGVARCLEEFQNTDDDEKNGKEKKIQVYES